MRILLGVGGGIAAYKSAELARLLMEQGYAVQVVMTRAAEEFIRPLTFAALTGEKVLTDLFAIESAIVPRRRAIFGPDSPRASRTRTCLSPMERGEAGAAGLAGRVFQTCFTSACF